MECLKVHVLYLGRIECKRSHLISCEDEEAMIKSPIVATLIQHPTLGNILYDTGNSPFYSSEYGTEMIETYPIPEFISIEAALKSKGFTPADIDILIISHLHFDHVGGLKYFAGTKAFKKVIVAEEDLKNACYSVMTGNPGAYVKTLFEPQGVQYQPINGTVQLAQDLTLFIQKSHTPGVIGMLVKTENHGTVIFTSDTIYTKDNYENELPPGGKINKTQQEFYDNLNFIKEMKEKYQATIFFGHDYEQVVEWSNRGVID